MPEALLDEVTALVEWPVVYECHFEEEFLAVPQECLILTMQTNQKYFALTDSEGKLRSRFLIVSNIETSTPEHIIGGNERVVRPRLSDAKFFLNKTRRRRWHRVCRCWPTSSTTTSWARKLPAQSASSRWPAPSLQNWVATWPWPNAAPCWPRPIC